ncbi:MAG: NADH-quinone oxidoreductase subunit J [candidate division Zixibacteria bacterium]|nr:NADH-quinone oxidoreductase subunit J [candidate division Zixibacteria bacterium]
MNLDTVIFFAAAVVAVFGATMMIAQKNPIASALYLILSLVAQAILYVQLGGLFLGSILIVVYAGAIMVLFLFVIMLLNLRSSDDLGPPPPALGRFTKYAFGILLSVELIVIVKAARMPSKATGVLGFPVEDFGSVKAVSTQMFTTYVYPLELTGILMLIAVVGAVVIAKKENNAQVSDDSGSDRPAKKQVS